MYEHIISDEYKNFGHFKVNYKDTKQSFYCYLWKYYTLGLEDRNNSWGVTYLNSSE